MPSSPPLETRTINIASLTHYGSSVCASPLHHDRWFQLSTASTMAQLKMSYANARSPIIQQVRCPVHPLLTSPLL